jgi:hypothetical protein
LIVSAKIPPVIILCQHQREATVSRFRIGRLSQLVRTGLAAAVLAILPTMAKAGFIQYNWQVDGAILPPFNSASYTNGSPGQLILPSDSGTTSSAPNSPTTIATVSLLNWSTSQPNIPVSSLYDGQGYAYLGTQYAITLNITDVASGQSGKFTLNGDAESTWEYKNGAWSFISTQFGGFPFQYYSLTLGKNLYTMTMSDPPYGLPSSPSGPLVSNIMVSVEPAPAPEPGTLLLAACGFPFVGLILWRRWRPAYAVLEVRLSPCLISSDPQLAP